MGEPINAKPIELMERSFEYKNVCPHITSGVDLSFLKKSIIKNEFHDKCPECKGCSPKTGEDSSLWICLKCGNQACGRTWNKHALRHYQAPRFDLHCLCVDATRWTVWCYKCRDWVNVNSNKILQESVQYLEKLALTFRKRNEFIYVDNACVPPSPTPSGLSEQSTVTSDQPQVQKESKPGNVCLFNMAMQYLGQTPHLRQVLEDTIKAGQYLAIPDGKVQKEDVVIKPLDGAYLDICNCGKPNYLIYNAARTKKLAFNHNMKIAKILETASNEFGIKAAKLVEEGSGVIQYILERLEDDLLVFNSEEGGVYMILQDHEVWEERGDIAELKVADRFRDGYKFCDFRRKKKCFVGKKFQEQRRLSVQQLMGLASKILHIQGVELVREADGATLFGEVEYKDVVMVLEKTQKWLPEDY